MYVSQSDIVFEVLLEAFLRDRKRTPCSAHLITIDLNTVVGINPKF